MIRKVKVLVADDSALMRREIKAMVEEDSNFEVIECVKDGLEAVEKTRELDPDLIILDINMPNMDGLTALHRIMQEYPKPCIMLSSLTQEGSLSSYEALELGAIDFVGKPSGTISRDIVKVKEELNFKMRAAVRASKKNLKPRTKKSKVKIEPSTPIRKSSKEIIVIGQSTGGPRNIMDVIPFLPANLEVPIIIVQHMPAHFTKSFAERLNNESALHVKEARSSDVLLQGNVYLAPGDRHLVTVKQASKNKISLRTSRYPENTLHRPSVDVTMESALSIYGDKILAVLMTGMGADGAETMKKIHEAGGTTIAESEETCVVYGMPREAIEIGAVDFVLPSYKIAEKIIEIIRSEKNFKFARSA